MELVISSVVLLFVLLSMITGILWIKKITKGRNNFNGINGGIKMVKFINIGIPMRINSTRRKWKWQG